MVWCLDRGHQGPAVRHDTFDVSSMPHHINTVNLDRFGAEGVSESGMLGRGAFRSMRTVVSALAGPAMHPDLAFHHAS